MLFLKKSIGSSLWYRLSLIWKNLISEILQRTKLSIRRENITLYHQLIVRNDSITDIEAGTQLIDSTKYLYTRCDVEAFKTAAIYRASCIHYSKTITYKWKINAPSLYKFFVFGRKRDKCNNDIQCFQYKNSSG